MGIKNLNRFLYENCSKKSIKKIHLNQLSNKTLAIDTSIYLYKYSSEDLLMENMYLLISILKSYNIIPIFIFDGKPPPEKRELLQQRRMEKKEAEEKYNKMKTELNENKVDEKQQVEMDKLKRLFVRINDDEIKKVKLLIDSYGFMYYDAPGEADHLCAYLVQIGKAWGCISDDMDMFLYGCKYVVRNISLLKHSAILYDSNQIWDDLEMSEQIFREIMVISGTDYNIHSKTSLKETIKWYYEYLKYKERVSEKILGFYVWLFKNTKYIVDYKELLDVYSLFSCNNCDKLEKWKDIEIVVSKINYKKIQEIMEPEGFIFL
jgi:hypothetical protein